MGISTSVSERGEKITIAVTGNFDFELYDAFRSAYADTPGQGVEYEVNLSGTEHVDSSALGMLLLLREHAGGETAKINITQASDDARKILRVANFSKLFSI